MDNMWKDMYGAPSNVITKIYIYDECDFLFVCKLVCNFFCHMLSRESMWFPIQLILFGLDFGKIKLYISLTQL